MSEWPASSPLLPVSDSVQLSLGVRDFGEEVTQFVTWVVYTAGAVRYFPIRPTFPYLTHTAITKLYVTDRQAAAAIDIIGLEVVLKLFGPFFGNFRSGLIIVFFGCFIRRAFSTNNTTISHYFLHITSLTIADAMNDTEASIHR